MTDTDTRICMAAFEHAGKLVEISGTVRRLASCLGQRLLTTKLSIINRYKRRRSETL